MKNQHDNCSRPSLVTRSRRYRMQSARRSPVFRDQPLAVYALDRSRSRWDLV